MTQRRYMSTTNLVHNQRNECQWMNENFRLLRKQMRSKTNFLSSADNGRFRNYPMTVVRGLIRTPAKFSGTTHIRQPRLDVWHRDLSQYNSIIDIIGSLRC